MSNKYVLVDCPNCGTEHRIHKLRAARGMIRCTKCKVYFFVAKKEMAERT